MMLPKMKEHAKRICDTKYFFLFLKMTNCSKIHWNFSATVLTKLLMLNKSTTKDISNLKESVKMFNNRSFHENVMPIDSCCYCY